MTKTLCDELLGAVENADLKTIGTLLRKYPFLFHFDIAFGWPVLHRCLANHYFRGGCIDLDLVKLYIANGGDVNRRTSSGVSLLFLVAKISDAQEITDYLAAHGARMSSFEQGVVTLMREESAQRARAIVTKLIKKEPHLVHIAGDDGFTLLHHAVKEFQFHLVPLLLDWGANVNAISSTGRSPLGMVERRTSEEEAACYNLLVSRGARFTPIEELGDKIRQGEDQAVIEKLKKNPELMRGWCLPSWPFLHMAACFGTANLVEYFLNRKTDPNIPNEEGKTALHRATNRTAEKGSDTLEIIRLLIKHKADISSRDNFGYTPLHEAAVNSWEEPVKLLIELGADINAIAKNGKTPLDVVDSMGYSTRKSLLSWLKARGAISGKSRWSRD